MKRGANKDNCYCLKSVFNGFKSPKRKFSIIACKLFSWQSFCLNLRRNFKKIIMKRFLGYSLLAMIAMTILLTTSCNKYPEGSKFTLLTAKMRLVKTWTQVSDNFSNSTFTTEETGYSDIMVTFGKDNTYNFSGKWNSISFEENGTWEFNDDKTTITLTENPTNGSNVQVWTIVKLKNKELKVSRSDNGFTHTIEFAGE